MNAPFAQSTTDSFIHVPRNNEFSPHETKINNNEKRIDVMKLNHKSEPTASQLALNVFCNSKDDDIEDGTPVGSKVFQGQVDLILSYPAHQ